STPALAALDAGDARQAGHRPRNADEVGSSPTAGSCFLTSTTLGPDNPTIKQVRLLPARLIVPWSSLECSPRSHPGGRWFKSSRDYWISTPVAKRPRHLLDVEKSAGSSPAGGTAEWTGAWFPARSQRRAHHLGKAAVWVRVPA